MIKQLFSHLPLFRELLIQPREEFKQIFDESGISLHFNDYMRKISVYIPSIFGVALVSSFLVHAFFLNVPIYRMIPAVLSISFSISCLSAILFLYYPLYRRNLNKTRIERDLVYVLSYMTILSASSLSIEQILERISEMDENPPFRQLAIKFLIDIKLFGFEVSSALKDISRRSPSEILKKLLNSINNNIKTSGDLKSLLYFEMKNHLQMKKESLKKMVGSLTYMGEIYVALIVVTPILFILMLTILSILGGGSLKNSAIPQLNLIVFFGIPIIATGFMVMLDTIIGGEE